MYTNKAFCVFIVCLFTMAKTVKLSDQEASYGDSCNDCMYFLDQTRST